MAAAQGKVTAFVGFNKGKIDGTSDSLDDDRD